MPTHPHVLGWQHQQRGAMSFKFLKQPLSSGRYEPEGIYLTLPLENQCVVVQAWGEHDEFYRSYTYNGIPLKGHNGVDLQAQPGASVFAVDEGRVTGIGIERPGWGRYVKIEHEWGESFYAHLGTLFVDAGQVIQSAQKIGTVEARLQQTVSGSLPSYLHLGIRIKPYNRFDGWGGFVDPIPFLEPERLVLNISDESTFGSNHSNYAPQFPPHPMGGETSKTHRP